MSHTELAVAPRIESPRSAAPTWWIVFLREFTDLWMGGRGLTLILFFSILIGLWSYVLASNEELRLIPPKEMVWEMLEATIAVACLICLIAGADTISGDRERATLEGLLLTPTSRRQIVAGKYLAVVTLWPGILAVTIPYLAVLSQGDSILVPAVLLGILMGSVMAPAMAAMGMLMSISSNTIKASMTLSLAIYTLIMMPQAMPGKIQSGTMGLLLQTVSPLMATFHFMAKILVNHRPLSELWPWLIAPILFATIMLTLLHGFASPGLRLEADPWRRLRSVFGRVFGSLAIVSCLALSGANPAKAQEAATAIEVAAPAAAAPAVLEVSIDMQYTVASQGDSILYKTTVANHTGETARPLTVAMNIINLNAAGDIVDPEDWSPQRTQYIEALAPGAEVTLSWMVNAIMDGDYMIYMVAVPRPDAPEATSLPVASPGIHLTVRPFTKLNPKGILAYVVGTPLVLILGMGYLHRRRRRTTEGSSE